MNRKTFKNLVIGGCVILFIGIVSIIAIVIAQGKKINQEGQVIETSIIRINSIPNDIKASINGKDVTITDNKIENLDPGLVKLKLTKDGYSPWEKDIQIDAGVVKDIYAQLYPIDITFEKITNTNIDKTFYSNDLDVIYYTVLSSQTSSENGIWKYKISRSLLEFGANKPVQIAKFDAALLNSLKSNYNIKIANDNNKILLTIPEQNILYVYDSNQNNVKTDLLTKLGFYPSQINWFRNSDSLSLIKDNLLIEYDLGSDQSTLINYNTSTPPIFDFSYNTFFYLKSSTLFKYINKNSTAVTLQTNSITKTDKISDIKVSQSNSNILALKVTNGLVFIDLERNYINQIATSGNIIAISSNGKSIIFEIDDSLYSYNVEDSIDAKSYVPSIHKIGLNNSDIDNIYFSPTGKNIITQLKEKNGEKVLELMDLDGGNKIQLIKDFKITGNTTQIPSGTDLYALIEEKDVNSKVTNNIYKFSLEVK